jgi:nicotinamidase-related amidase
MTWNSPGSTPHADTALVAIDMQVIFQDPHSQWHVSTYEQAAARVGQLVARFPSNVIWTKFVRDAEEYGSWGAYYDRWDSCRLEPGAAEWGLTLPVKAHDRVLTLPTFSKWGPELASLTATQEHLIVCGVATDCCVLSTVLGAVDAGKRVTLVADACGGATPEAHAQAIGLVKLLSPMVSVVDTADLLDSVASVAKVPC